MDRATPGEPPPTSSRTSDRKSRTIDECIVWFPGLLTTAAALTEPNLPSIYRFLAYRETDAGEETFLKNIVALRPAHALLYSPRRDYFKTWQYWDLEPAAEIRYTDERAYSERLHDLLRQSVKIRMRSDVPVGSCLSG